MNFRFALPLLVVALLAPACAELDDSTTTARVSADALRSAPTLSAVATPSPRTAGDAFTGLLERRSPITLGDVQPVLREGAEVAFALRFGDGGVVGVNVLLDGFGLDAVASARTLVIDPQSIRDFAASNTLGGTDGLAQDEVAAFLSQPSSVGRSFCDNEDGTRGHSVVATASASLDGVPGTVALQVNPYMSLGQLGLSRVASQLAYMAPLDSEGFSPRPTKPGLDDAPEEAETEWVISWPTLACFFQRVEGRRGRVCAPNDCTVSVNDPLLRQLARAFGFGLPLDPGLLPEAYGDCGKVSFLGLIPVGCQCIIRGVRFFPIIDDISGTPAPR